MAAPVLGGFEDFAVVSSGVGVAVADVGFGDFFEEVDVVAEVVGVWSEARVDVEAAAEPRALSGSDGSQM